MAPERAVTEMIHGQQPGISEAADNPREPPGAFFVGGWTTGMQNGDLEDVIRSRFGTGPREIHDKTGSKKVIMRTAEEAATMIAAGDFMLACRVSKRNPKGAPRKVRPQTWWQHG